MENFLLKLRLLLRSSKEFLNYFKRFIRLIWCKSKSIEKSTTSSSVTACNQLPSSQVSYGLAVWHRGTLRIFFLFDEISMLVAN